MLCYRVPASLVLRVPTKTRLESSTQTFKSHPMHTIALQARCGRGSTVCTKVRILNTAWRTGSSHSNTAPLVFKMAQNLDLRQSAGAKTRLESRIKKCMPHCICRYSATPTTGYGFTDSIPKSGHFLFDSVLHVQVRHTHILTSSPCLFQHDRKSGFEMCFRLSTLGAGAKTRLESRIKKFTPHCVCIVFALCLHCVCNVFALCLQVLRQLLALSTRWGCGQYSFACIRRGATASLHHPP